MTPIKMTPKQAETVARAIRDEMNALDPAVRAVFKPRWEQFRSWCKSQGVSAAPAFPPDRVRYLKWLLDQYDADAVSVAEQSIAFTHAAIAKALDVADVQPLSPSPSPPLAPSGYIDRRLLDEP